MSGEEKLKVLMTIKNAAIILLLLLAIVGLQRIIEPQAWSKDSDSIMLNGYDALSDNKTYPPPPPTRKKRPI